jgi:ABC-type lipoprotein export system ATPase subunit
VKLELKGITKRFGSLVANDHIDVVVEPGQIHCLLGENGAGKSTLMNVLYGLYGPSEGEILIDDEPVSFPGPGNAMAAGTGMGHQHFMLVPAFTVAENVALGWESTKPGGVLDLDVTRRKIGEISDRYGFDVDPDALVEDLPVGVQQRVEIIKALDGDELLGRGVKDVLNAGVGFVPAGTGRDVLGLMMAGLSPLEAQADAAAKHHSAAAPAPAAQPVQEPSSGAPLGGAIAGIGGSFFTLVAIDGIPYVKG